MLTPRQLLENASGEVFEDENGEPHRISLAKGLNRDGVAQFEQTVGHTLPESVVDLVQFASGFTLLGRDVDFTTRFDWPPLDAAFPSAVWLSSCDVLDDWFIEVNRLTGEWGPAYYFSHDPAVFVYACDGLTDFLSGWLEDARRRGRSRLDVARAASTATWYRQRHMRWAGDLVDSTDAALRAFAAGLSSDHLVSDLRPREPGLGVPWGWGKMEVKRHEDELLFAVRPGWLRRLLLRRRAR